MWVNKELSLGCERQDCKFKQEIAAALLLEGAVVCLMHVEGSAEGVVCGRSLISNFHPT